MDLRKTKTLIDVLFYELATRAALFKAEKSYTMRLHTVARVLNRSPI